MKSIIPGMIVFLIESSNCMQHSNLVLYAVTQDVLSQHVKILSDFAKQQHIDLKLEPRTSSGNNIDVNTDKKYYNDAYWRVYTVSKQLEAGINNMLDKTVSREECVKQALDKMAALFKKYTTDSLVTVPTVVQTAVLLKEHYKIDTDVSLNKFIERVRSKK